ncbi:hypothetical protein AGMMS49938_05340 [Fibrobacterales bacterium]|nr:hypothetical protein AGMMS49938_05340 [Fibrobacterales bacterium]
MIERKSYSSDEFRLELPYLLEVQKASYERFLQAATPAKDRRNEGLERVFKDAFPVMDAKGLLVLRYSHYTLAMPKHSLKECRERGVTFSRPLIVRLELQTFKEDGEEKKLQDQVANDVFFCDLPMMTDNGTFIINGAERVVISQLHRSPGVSFDSELLPSGKTVFQSRIIPNRGSWLEFNTENDILYMLIDRKKKLPATILLRCIGYDTNEQILAEFYESETVDLNAQDEVIKALEGRVLYKNVISNNRIYTVWLQTGNLINLLHRRIAIFCIVICKRVVNKVILIDISLYHFQFFKARFQKFSAYFRG